MHRENNVKEALEAALGHVEASRELKRRTLEKAVGRRTVGRYMRYAAVLAVAASLIVLFALANGELLSGTGHPQASSTPGTAPVQGTNKAIVPQYIPPSYEMKEVESSIAVDKPVPDITIRFSSTTAESLELKRSAKSADKTRDGFEQVTIEGNTGWIKMTEQGDMLLIWEDREYEYTLIGKISEDDAKKMAGSIYLLEKEAGADEE